MLKCRNPDWSRDTARVGPYDVINCPSSKKYCLTNGGLIWTKHIGQKTQKRISHLFSRTKSNIEVLFIQKPRLYFSHKGASLMAIFTIKGKNYVKINRITNSRTSILLD